MEWKAIITIYLAVGAPFAVARWFRTNPRDTGWRRMAAAALAAVVWPYLGLHSIERIRGLDRRSAGRENDLSN